MNSISERCFWCDDSELYQTYHDTEWGFPVDDDIRLFEKICLEGFQAGLSWITILKKREGFRAAFAGFDFTQVSQFTEQHVVDLLQNASIVRHRGKIEATINNAKQAIALKDEFGSLAAYFWQFQVNPDDRPSDVSEVYLRTQTTTPESIALSKDLKKRGWKFVGPTTMYAFMQAMGLVNDHTSNCSIRRHVQDARQQFAPPTPHT